MTRLIELLFKIFDKLEHKLEPIIIEYFCVLVLIFNLMAFINFYNFFGNPVPFASRDKLVNSLPYLKKKFLNHLRLIL